VLDEKTDQRSMEIYTPFRSRLTPSQPEMWTASSAKKGITRDSALDEKTD